MLQQQLQETTASFSQEQQRLARAAAEAQAAQDVAEAAAAELAEQLQQQLHQHSRQLTALQVIADRANVFDCCCHAIQIARMMCFPAVLGGTERVPQWMELCSAAELWQTIA
jgi:ABC-type transporter Mla subunit MlaD